jgi:translation initiation factor 2-alpha kinase 4
VSKTELVPYLLQHLVEQKRVDLTTSGTLTAGQLTSSHNDKPSHHTLDIQLLLPSERKQLKHNKKLLYDKGE